MRTASAIAALSLALLSLHAQTTPDSLPKATAVSEYCQSLAAGNKHAEALENTCQFALTVQKVLPNYICQEKIKRSINGKSVDLTELQVTSANGEDAYSNIRVDGKPVKADLFQLPGLWSSGEFGMLLYALFLPENKASFKFIKEERLHYRPALLFTFEIREADNRSFYVWNFYGKKWTPGYSGSLWVDKTSRRPAQIELSSTRVPASNYVQQLFAKTEYGEIALADDSVFLLPLRSNLKACRNMPWGQSCFRHAVEFTNCHKFGAETKILSVE